jgi:hypothetical protein
VDLHDLTTVLSAEGPFVTVLVDSESDVEQAADKYELQWKNIVRELEDKGVDPATRDAITAAKGEHWEGDGRLVVATTGDATVRLAVPLHRAPRSGATVEVSPLPRLLPLLEEVNTRVPHVVVLADRTGADVSAYYDAETVAAEVTVKGHAPDIRKVPVGGWSHLRYQHRAENGWAANAREIVSTITELASDVNAQLLLLVGDERELVYVREKLPTELKPKVVELAGGRSADGSEPLVRQRIADALALHVAHETLDLLGAYAQERGQGKRAVDGLPDVLEALRKAQVQTLLLTTDTPQGTLWFGPEPTDIAGTGRELTELGVADPQEGPLVDVLIRAAVGTGADVQLVPGEMAQAPDMGLGAVLRYADSLGTNAAAQA